MEPATEQHPHTTTGDSRYDVDHDQVALWNSGLPPSGGARRGLGQTWELRALGARDLVFPNASGGLMIPDNLTKRSFKAALKRAGLPAMRFHDLRHTAATLLLGHGVHPKVVSEMLGHADISITLRVYAHVLPHMQQAAVALMETLFGAPPSEPSSELSVRDEQAVEEVDLGSTVVKPEKKNARPRKIPGRAGGDGGESNSPSKQMTEPIYYRHIRCFASTYRTPIGRIPVRRLAGSCQRLASSPRWQSPTVCRPDPIRQAEIGRTRFTGV